MHLLVTGGLGYVGSHVVRVLLQRGHTVSIVDDLSSGHRQTLPDGVPLHVGRCGDRTLLDRVVDERRPDGVMHMAAKCAVGESMEDPLLYYDYNVSDGLALLDWMVAHEIPWIVHSSTCAVYGHPDEQPIDEQTCPRPLNAYGATKLAVDRAIEFTATATPLRGATLRYFNAAGSDPDAELGEDKLPRSNLVPCVFDVALGLSDTLQIYGDDYPTGDGTGVRDYVHVMDLAEAHLAALEHLQDGGPGGVFNLGTGNGHSVHEVLEAARRVTGAEIPARVAPRRPGDPASLVADAGRAGEVLGWTPRRSDLETMLGDAWRWRSRHPEGYGEDDR